MGRATNLVKEILENKLLRKAIKENDMDTIERCLVTELEENANLRDFVFATREREHHTEDVRQEILYLNNDGNNNKLEKQIIATDEDIEHITDLYEECLWDSDDWQLCLKWALEQFKIEKFKKQKEK